MGNGSDVNDIGDVLPHQQLFSLKNPPETHIKKFKTLIKVPQSKQIRIFSFMRSDSVITSPPIGGGRGIVMPMSVCLCVCYIRQRSWANVMYSSPFVCLSVCLFVCLSVCLFVCLFVC